MLKELIKDFNLSEEKINKLNELRDICLEYNKHTNLTSITDEEEFNVKHILDSLSILKFVDLEGSNILDVGSGGGFPGLVLAIVLDNSKVTMLDSNNKKTKYIEYAISELKLKNATTINARVEESDTKEKYDVVLSRAVASLPILLEITADTLMVGGEAIYYKGSNLDEEVPTEWQLVEDTLGLSFNNIYNFKLDESTERKIISFSKINSCKIGYPRDYSRIKSKPIY